MVPTPAYKALADEVDRIVNSPYPVQLKSLRDIVCRQCTTEDISRWVLSRPCQVNALAKSILQGMQQWPYVLNIATRLSCNEAIRNALLFNRPSLLHDVLSLAVHEDYIGSRYTEAALALLSHPLTKDIALPVEVQSLVIRLFDNAANEPSVKTIRPIHQILQGTSSLLLGLLSSNVLARFETHLFEIIRNRNDDSPSLTLYCLAIMRLLAQTSDEGFDEPSISSYDTQELLASTQPISTTKWKPETVKQYFAERKAQKTMQYTVLRVIWACTSTTGESLDDKLESLTLANDIITAVPCAEIGNWRKANALVSRKLEEKVHSLSDEPKLQFQARCFLVRLTSDDHIAAGVVGGLRETILDMDKVTEALRGSKTETSQCLANSEIFDEGTTTWFLQSVTDFAATGSSDDVVERSRCLIQMVQQLRAAISGHEAIIDGAMLALDVLSCGPKLQALLRLVPEAPVEMEKGTRPHACLQATHQARNDLIHELCSLFLKAALCSSHQNYSAPQATFSLLLDMHAASARLTSRCAHGSPGNINPHNEPLTIVPSEAVANSSAPSWREALQTDIATRASAEYERLATLFTKSCAALEARCEDVEKPLREAEAQKHALEQDCIELQNAYTKLESKDIDRSIQYNALERERDEHWDALEDLRRERDELHDSYQELQHRLDRAGIVTKKEIEEARHEAESAKLEHVATLAKKEEDMHELRLQLDKTEAELVVKGNDSVGMTHKLEESENVLVNVRGELARLKQAHQDQQTSIDRATIDLQNTLNSKEALEADLVKITTERDEQAETYRAETARREDEAREKLLGVERDHQQSVASITQDHETTVQSFKRKLEEIENESRLNEEKHLSAIGRYESDMVGKQTKIEHLNRKCKQKDRQIAEANLMRSNLMTAMGLGNQNPQMTLPHRPSRSPLSQTQEGEPQSQEDPSPPTPCSGDDAERRDLAAGLSFESNGSSNQSRNGPTPKRARPSRSSKRTSPSQPRFRTSAFSRTSRSAVKRQPLLSISANPALSKSVPPKTSSNAKDVDPDETTFDGSELFGGTP